MWSGGGRRGGGGGWVRALRWFGFLYVRLCVWRVERKEIKGRGERRGSEGDILIHCNYLTTVQINVATSFCDNTNCTICGACNHVQCASVSWPVIFLCFTGSNQECRWAHDDLCLLQRVWEQVEGERCHVMSCDVMWCHVMVIMSCFSHLTWYLFWSSSLTVLLISWSEAETRRTDYIIGCTQLIYT